MFRAAAVGPFDEVVSKATDENLTSEDWGAILEVCDKVTSDSNGPKEVVQSLIKRLAHRNANVQLYTLELAHALCQNCGKNVHREVSSRAFTDALLKLANDRNSHNQVKAKILEKTKEWSDMFANDPDLGIMYDAYFRLKQSNPTLHPPSAPQKQGLTEMDRQKEEDELQMALKLSLQEEERKKAVPSSSSAQASSSSHTQQQQQQQQQPQTAPAPASSGTTAATVSRVRALYDFTPSEPGELEFKRGDVIAVLESVYKDWWRGSLKGRTGIFPLNYVEKLTDPTPDELHREAQMEAEVFAEIKNVEKLLTLLSTTNAAPREEDNEEISKLYHQTLAIRPKLIKLIEKYSQKKDDFTQLNEKFIKARRDYESLLESSMSHPPQHHYQQYAMRPAPSGQGYGQAPGGYSTQDPHGYYAGGPSGAQGHPGTQGDRPQYQTSSPPNFQAPGQGQAPPFFVAGSEVPAHHHGQSQQQHEAPHQAPNTTSSPPQAYSQYSQPPGSTPGPNTSSYGGPTSTYGAQELATSAYDSPVASHNPQSAPFPDGDNPINSTPGPSSSGPYAGQPPYQSYGSTSDQAAPPVSTGQSSHDTMVPAGLQPGLDGRQSLPSQQTQYKPYIPPSAVDGASAPTPNDYYRSGVY